MAPADAVRAALLRGVAEAARAALDARAASITLVDPGTGDLVFEAVAGGGGPELLGAHFRADEGLAGHVVQSGTAVFVEDLARDPRFAHDIAVEIGYEPDALAAAPIGRGSRVVGVLSVLDPGEPPAGGVLAVLDALCIHAAAALELGDALGAPTT
ncbi:MAG TPA: GAF domain-containing protein [Solirubrobacteraceae bacterium]|nr:GAF domain-containing protein [Solirubrobacteraceae bacterium]